MPERIQALAQGMSIDMRRVHTIISLTLLLLIFINSPHIYAQDETVWLLEQINCLRQRVGSPPLTLNPSLTVAANRQSTDLITGQLTDFHVGLDGSTPTTRARDAGFTGSVGENVAWGRTASDAFNWWLNSSVHYTNMTEPHWKEIGIGIAQGTNGGTWYTLVFGAMNWAITDPVTTLPCDTLAPLELIAETTDENEAPIEPSPTEIEISPTPIVATLDENGYIQHSIQAGETPGIIILKYGFTWADLPELMEQNDMTEFEATQLNIGDIFLIPVREGIVTPTLEEAGEDDANLLAVAVESDTPSIAPSATPTVTQTTTATATPQAEDSDLIIVQTDTPAPTTTTVPTAMPTIAASPMLTQTLTLMPPAVFLPTETAIPQVAVVASPTRIVGPITEIAPVVAIATPAPPAPVEGTSDNTLTIVLGVVVVVQAIIIVILAPKAISRWRDSLERD